MHDDPISAPGGNASNPAPQPGLDVPEQSTGAFDKKAETYLREGGNIEDTPDAREEADAEGELHPGDE